MNESLLKWADVVEEIFEQGRLYDSLRSGPSRCLALSRSQNGVWTAEWTNRLPSEENWGMRMHGHDKEHALAGLQRRLTEMVNFLSSEAKRRETPLPGSSPLLRAAPGSSPKLKGK